MLQNKHGGHIPIHEKDFHEKGQDKSGRILDCLSHYSLCQIRYNVILNINYFLHYTLHNLRKLVVYLEYQLWVFYIKKDEKIRGKGYS
jgi:hypothetical protein